MEPAGAQETIVAIASVISDVVVAVAAIFAAVAAVRGLNAWRNELKGKSEYQLAKELLKSVFKVREAFMRIRYPIITPEEYPSELMDENGNLKHGGDYKATLHVYRVRFGFLDSAQRELEEKFIEAQVEWGSQYKDKAIPLRGCIIELQRACYDMLSRKEEKSSSRVDPEAKKKERAVLYYMGEIAEDPDYVEFTNKVNKAIRDFEDWLRPIIGKG